MAAQHVIVGLSGGVDSAVAAWLLLQQGYRVGAMFMVNWTEDEEGYCTAAEDFASARAVAEELGIPLQRVDFSAEYRARVFDRFLADYAAGKTPNPDILCNREVKFQPFRDHAIRIGADHIATGHYAALESSEDGPRLFRAHDENKDQTYFLAGVERRHFERVLFPLAGYTKAQVRDLARSAGLPNHRRKDSTGICFIGERQFGAFLGTYLAPNPGEIEDDSGAVIGRHEGLMRYTLGQRRGLAIGGRRGAREAPWYVVAKDLQRNVLRVSQDPDHPMLLSRTVLAGPFHWIRQPSPLPATLHARIRHRQALQSCRVVLAPEGQVLVTFEVPQRAAVSGQYLALYSDRECLGCGEIVRAGLESDTD